MLVAPLMIALVLISAAESRLGLSLSTIKVLRSRACNPAATAAWLPYTGVRIQRELEYHPRGSKEVQHRMIITYCKRGTVEYELEYPIAASMDVAWNHTVCPAVLTERSESDVPCTKLARRKKYALRQLSIYRPGALVGGLFQCQKSGSKCVPAKPLVADSVLSHWMQVKSGHKIVYRIPYFRTPDVLDRFYAMNSNWAQLISETEQYDYRGGGDGRSILDRSADSVALMLTALIQDVALSEASISGQVEQNDTALRDGLRQMIAYVNAYFDQWK
ncbi:hypothetical protein TRVA0_028S01266 [Trichomonascus vanleenenianus]|uniref:uncharacterized protein n=1 Tax=Trichomonascus vanleenenianus TaxID=2268995 RepID=UPI003ECAEC59